MLDQLAADSWTGTWGDYDRDGLVDLFIGRGGSSGSGRDASPSGPLADRLLHNDGGGEFSDTSELGVNSAGNVTTISAAWADYDGDGNLDLCVGSRQAAPTVVYRNTINSLDVQSFMDQSGLFSGLPFFRYNVTSVQWADLDNDGDFDLVLGQVVGEAGPRIFWNDGVSFGGGESLESGIPVAAQTVLDYDLDGRQDLLLAPPDQGGANAPVLMRNPLATPGAGFADVTSQVGLASVTSAAIHTLAAADFGGSAGAGSQEDGDFDLYLGRPRTAGKYFYQAKASIGNDLPANHWLRVALKSSSGNNHFGQGARVTVQIPASGSPTHLQTQVVDGGSGRGTQSGLKPTFGLGGTSEDVLVTVVWPDGYEQSMTVPNGDLDREVEFIDDHPPGLLGGSLVWHQIPTLQGTMDWHFVWETEYATDPTLDKVVVENTVSTPRGGAVCVIGSTTLTPDSLDVSHMVLPDADGTQKHILIWQDRECGAPCTFEWKATSATPNGTETSPWREFSIYLCTL